MKKFKISKAVRYKKNIALYYYIYKNIKYKKMKKTLGHHRRKFLKYFAIITVFYIVIFLPIALLSIKWIYGPDQPQQTILIKHVRKTTHTVLFTHRK